MWFYKMIILILRPQRKVYGTQNLIRVILDIIFQVHVVFTFVIILNFIVIGIVIRAFIC